MELHPPFIRNAGELPNGREGQRQGASGRGQDARVPWGFLGPWFFYSPDFVTRLPSIVQIEACSPASPGNKIPHGFNEAIPMSGR
jgi:hypothetical protein